MCYLLTYIPVDVPAAENPFILTFNTVGRTFISRVCNKHIVPTHVGS